MADDGRLASKITSDVDVLHSDGPLLKAGSSVLFKVRLWHRGFIVFEGLLHSWSQLVCWQGRVKQHVVRLNEHFVASIHTVDAQFSLMNVPNVILFTLFLFRC